MTGDQVRQLSVAQFSKTFELPEDAGKGENDTYSKQCSSKYKTQRKFKKRDDASFESDIGRVEATLLEYGERHSSGRSKLDEEQEEKKRERAAQRGGNRGQLAGKIGALGGLAGANAGAGDAGQDGISEEERLKQLDEDERNRLNLAQQQLYGVDSDGKLTGANVGKIVSMNADTIRNAAAAYDEEMKRNIEQGIILDVGAYETPEEKANRELELKKKQEENNFKRQVEALKKKIKATTILFDEKKVSYDEMEAKLAQIKTTASDQQAHLQRYDHKKKMLFLIQLIGHQPIVFCYILLLLLFCCEIVVKCHI
jgi:hypothetical protein